MAKTVKIKRFQIGLNVLVQIAVVVFIVILANYFAFNHFKRWDFSRNRKYSLSEQTKQVLGTLKDTAKFVVFFVPDAAIPGAEIYPDVESLVKEYQYESGKNILVEYVDPVRGYTRTRELMKKYNLTAENVVVVDYQGRSKVVPATDMAEYDTSGAMFGQPPTVKAFTGEQALTSALLEVTEEKQNVIHVLQGQGEPDITGQELEVLKTYLERQNLKVEPLNLMNETEVPKDAQVLMLIAPQYDFSDREIEMLQKYWEKQGRMICLLDPGAYTPKLTAFLASLGIKRDDDRVLATVTLAPGLSGIVRDPAADFVAGSPITKKLVGVTTRLSGGTQSLTLDNAGVQGKNIRLVPLIEAAKGFWGEKDYNVGEDGAVYFDSQKDRMAPFPVAASAEMGALRDERVQVESSRLVAVGNAGFIQSEALTQANLDFVLSSINWLLSREALIGIAPKTPDTFSLNLSEAQLGRMSTLGMIVIPGAVAVAGILVWWRRRS